MRHFIFSIFDFSHFPRGAFLFVAFSHAFLYRFPCGRLARVPAFYFPFSAIIAISIPYLFTFPHVSFFRALASLFASRGL